MPNPLAFPTYDSNDTRFKIAIVQPGSWGDNINSTLMFAPLKSKYPDSILDIYTSTLYGSAFNHNPLINGVYLSPAHDKESALHQVHTIPPLLERSGYNKIFVPHPMINGDKWTSIKHGELGTNLICAWVRALEEYDVPYEMPLRTTLRLSQQERDNTSKFCRHLDMTRRNILMEVLGESGQSHWNPSWTVQVAMHLLNGHTNLFISRHYNSDDVKNLMAHAPGFVHFTGGLTIRECAELFNRCQIFFSVSSGLSNACNTDWCKKDGKWFEVTNSPAVTSAPIRKDGKVFWYNNNIDNFIQMLKSNGV